MPESISAAALVGLVEAASKVVVEKLASNTKALVQTLPKRAASALADHLKRSQNWADEIAFRDLHKTKSLTKNFVNLDCAMGIYESDAPPRGDARLVTTLLDESEPPHVVILGRPGAGKTTSLKRLAMSLYQRRSQDERLVPIVVLLRDLKRGESLCDYLATLFSISVKRPLNPEANDLWGEADLREARLRAVKEFLDGIRAVLLVDGLDETSRRSRARVERDLQDLMLLAVATRIVVTCRAGDYVVELPRATKYVILPLSSVQIQKFATKWLGADRAAAFVSAVDRSPYSGAEALPLTIAHLCAIYERRQAIPDRPRSVYRLIVRLLLADWDEQRGVRRKSKYADFDVDRKEDFLRHLAATLTKSDRRGSFSIQDLEQAYLGICEGFALPPGQYRDVAREIESHTGLVIRASAETLQFAHKSLQEYLTAEWIKGQPAVPSAILGMPDELAIATSLSTDPEGYVDAVVNRLVDGPGGERRARFASGYLNRLAIERPDFALQASLGWNLLVLTEMGREIAGFGVGPYLALTRAVASSYGIAGSLLEAMRMASINDHRPQVITVVAPERMAGRVAVQSLLRGQFGQGVELDRDVVRQAERTVAEHRKAAQRVLD